jgi:hypothetical protein
MRQMMIPQPVTARDVNECFLLGEALRAGAFDGTQFRTKLSAERQRIAAIPDDELFRLVADGDRQARYCCNWELQIVDLANCSVWPQLEGRPWASGPVPRVAQRVLGRNEPNERIVTMATSVRLWFAELPLIVFRRKRSYAQFRIDDGSHRAVASYLAGFRQAFAFVGDYAGDGELMWRWEGD